ncbi:MAG: choice-of-anchor D domain-containing protein [Sedimentisphaerales bacterium]|jgi:N-acetylneuraminic acid mutarotase
MTDTAKTYAKMMLIAILLAAVSVQAAADDAMWTWVSGENYYNPPNSTTPGGREGGVSWIDSDGNLWFFGGHGIGRDSASTGQLNGLWKYDVANWTFVKGYDAVTDVSYQVGIYGIKGSSDSGNTPGARSNSVSWTGTSSTSGYLYLFGGDGYDINGTYGLLNDLWRFSISSGNWTWVSGSSTVSQYGVYGTMGVAASSNTPGARGWSSAWADSNGTFWLFGGYGYGSSGSAGMLNDLWKYSGSKWTWVSGSKSTSHKGVYGTKGVADADNVPGTRYGSVLWMDTKGNLWLYGGRGYDSKGSGGYLSDLWKFDVGTSEWTWVSGSNLANRYSAGVYGTQGQSAANTTPGDREAFASWRDDYGYLWLFGGMGYDSDGTYGLLNDLWKFNGSVWEWVSGSKTVLQPGIYGTKGTADSDNTPGSRIYSTSCIDSNTLWLFGGSGYDQFGTDGNLNDLWKFGSIVPEGVQLRVFCEADEITSGQTTAVVLGTAPVRLTGPSKTFTIRNNGSETLVLDVPFAEPTHFTITQPAESTLVPGGDTTFTVTLDTAEIGVFEGTISFDNNDVDNNPFSFPVKGTVVLWQFGNIPGNTKNAKLTVPDVCDVSVTFSLTGGGYGEIVGDANFNQVNLYGTGEKSQLAITAKTETSVGDINSNSPLKAITAQTTNLRGNIKVSGSLTSLIINDANNSTDHTITVGSSLNPKATVSLGFGRVADLTINSQTPVKAISATEWLGGEINTPSIGTITTKGDRKRKIAGDLDANVTLDASVGSINTAGTLSGEWNCNTIKSVSALNIASAKLTLAQAPDAKVLALGALTAKSHITDSNIISGGNIGTINAGAMINSLCFAGIKDGVTGLPDPAVDINVAASIKSITVKGIKGEPNSFINSNIAAANILGATLNYPRNDNNGVPFGVSADFIKSLKIKNAGGSITLKNRSLPEDSNDFGDFKIRLN